MNPKNEGAAARRAAYSLAAGAAVGLAGSANAGVDASVKYSGVLDANLPQFNSEVFNFNGDGFNDLLLKNYVFGQGPYQGAYAYSGRILGFNAGLNYATALSAGAVIDSTSLAGSPFVTSLAFGATNPNAQFNNATNAYIGFSFLQFPQTYYGWVRVSIDNAAGSFVIHDWAYNTTPGAGIAAGTIPEPTSLGLLAAGAAGVATMRRRRAA